MEMLALQVILIILGTQFVTILGQDCASFLSKYNQARTLVSLRGLHEQILQANGFVMSKDDIGYFESESPGNKFLNFSANRRSDVFTTAASLIADSNATDLNFFGDHAICLNRSDVMLTMHPKYRSIDGYGNNLKHPYWGAAATPFARFAPKNYDDGIHSIRKSVTGSDLPSPRKIVLDVLLKAAKTPRESNIPVTLINLIVLYATHDMAHQVPVEAFNPEQEIRCCDSGNSYVLDPAMSHSSCLPVSVSGDDPFYQQDNIKCLNMVRSQQASAPCCIQYGEILNKATSFLDHSIVYGSDEASTRRIRSFSKGKMNMGSKNVLPVDENGKYLPTSDRLTAVPLGAIWPSLFARNHNQMAEALSIINPHWSDETLFQEARRINIALLQKIILAGQVVETVFRTKIEEPYNSERNPSTTLEFTTAAYRFLHYYVPSEMRLVDKDLNVTLIPISDTLGRIDLLENRYDDVLRGSLSQPFNFDQFSDELYNKFAKNRKGIGLDLLSIDIQRGRDHGLATFLETRKKCGLKANYTTFDDLLEIFPQSYVDLLSETYDSVLDIDLYVGGALETFATIGEVLVGATLGCTVSDQYRHTMGGDAYFYSHETNPHPFTAEQLVAINGLTLRQFFCTNSNIEFTQKVWFVTETPTNPIQSCEGQTPLDLSAWAENP